MSQDKQTDPIILIKPQPTVMGSNCWEEDLFFFLAILKHPTIGDWTFNLSLGRGQEVPLDYKGCWRMTLPPSLKHRMEGKTTGVCV